MSRFVRFVGTAGAVTGVGWTLALLLAQSISTRSARSALLPRLLASVRGTTGEVLALAPEATVDASA